MLKKQITIFIFLLINGLFFLLTRSVSAQAFTFDYLTYSDWGFAGLADSSKGKATSFLFLGINEYDRLEKTSASEISYREAHLYTAYRVFSTKGAQINVAVHTGILLAEGITSRMWGTPWFWGKFRIIRKPPVVLRMGFKWGKLGDAFWLEDNEIDVGLLAIKNFGYGILDGSLSYRVRDESDHGLTDFGRSFNEAGNEIHYKLKTTKTLGSKTFFALQVLGYISGDKKLDNVVLPDSHSRKTTIGGEFGWRTKKGGIFTLSLLYDIAGRYDKKGISLVFNVTG